MKEKWRTGRRRKMKEDRGQELRRKHIVENGRWRMKWRMEGEEKEEKKGEAEEGEMEVSLYVTFWNSEHNLERSQALLELRVSPETRSSVWLPLRPLAGPHKGC